MYKIFANIIIFNIYKLDKLKNFYYFYLSLFYDFYQNIVKFKGSMTFIVGKLFYHKGHQDITQSSQSARY